MAKQFTEFSITRTFPVTPAEIYYAWLDSDLHTAMTGGHAECSADEGESFSAWDGYISGKNIRLVPNKIICQSWRTTEFLAGDEDSLVELQLSEMEDGGCQLTLIHSKIPQGQPDYKQGWNEFYFLPMLDYFKK